MNEFSQVFLTTMLAGAILLAAGFWALSLFVVGVCRLWVRRRTSHGM